MRKTLLPLLAIALMTCLSSCLEYSATIVINKDGSAQIEETSLVGGQLKAMVAQIQQGGGPANMDPKGANALKGLLPTQEKADERAKSLGAGVTVKSREEIKSPDGREGVKVVYSVPDINKLNFKMLDSSSQEDQKPISFAASGGKVTVTLPRPQKKAGAEAPKMPDIPQEQLQAQMAMIKPMFAGMRMSFKIKAPGGIASSDAAHVEGDTVTIMDLQMDKILEKPDNFVKMMQTSQKPDMSAAQVAEMFKGVDGVAIEPKESLSISLK